MATPLLDPYRREPEEHECMCWLCAPRALPKIPEFRTDSYVGVGHPYGRRIPLWARPKYQFTVTLDGKVIGPAERWIFEVLTGPLGWIVWLYPPGQEPPGSTHPRDFDEWPICHCQTNPYEPGSPCTQVSFGHVAIEQQLDNPFHPHPSGFNLTFTQHDLDNALGRDRGRSVWEGVSWGTDHGRDYSRDLRILGGHDFSIPIRDQPRPIVHTIPNWWVQAKHANWEF